MYKVRDAQRGIIVNRILSYLFFTMSLAPVLPPSPTLLGTRGTVVNRSYSPPHSLSRILDNFLLYQSWKMNYYYYTSNHFRSRNMLKASPESPRPDNEDFDDVFSDYPCQISNKRNKQDIIDNRDNRDIKYSLDESMPLYPLKDLNQSLDSAPFTEPYRRRGSVAKIDKRRPSQCQNSGHISFAEILSHFQNQEACKMQKILSEQDAKKGNAKILGIFSQYPKLPRHLETEKDIFLLMAETRYEIMKFLLESNL